jgi:hypothetical protein
MRIGVEVLATENPSAVANPYDTANAFMLGRGDIGVPGVAYPCQTITDVQNAIGARSATNLTLYDAADLEIQTAPQGSTVYLSRVVGPAPVNATLTLADSVPHPTVAVTALSPGAFSNGYHIVVSVVSTNYTVQVLDGAANVLETWGPFPNASGNAPLLAVTSAYVAFTQSAASGFTSAAPAVLASTALATGNDNYSSATLTSFQTAGAAFVAAEGPGQISAPGQTNTTLSGIWSALGAIAASVVNRVAICEMDDGQSAATLIADLATFGTSTVASYCAFWAGNGLASNPYAVGSVQRTIPASALISALCAQADAKGNPNLAAAGDNFVLKTINGFTTSYSQTDIDLLNAAGINTFNTVFGKLENYGFVTPVPQAVDTIYWQFNHSRMRMALVALAQTLGQPFVFAQISRAIIAAFSGDLALGLAPFVTSGAISTIAPDGSTDQGFTIDVVTPNTPTTMGLGQLNASLAYRPAPFAQLIQISLNAIPTTQNL